jgi:hypothetical protein
MTSSVSLSYVCADLSLIDRGHLVAGERHLMTGGSQVRRTRGSPPRRFRTQTDGAWQSGKIRGGRCPTTLMSFRRHGSTRDVDAKIGGGERIPPNEVPHSCLFFSRSNRWAAACMNTDHFFPKIGMREDWTLPRRKLTLCFEVHEIPAVVPVRRADQIMTGLTTLEHLPAPIMNAQSCPLVSCPVRSILGTTTPSSDHSYKTISNTRADHCLSSNNVHNVQCKTGIGHSGGAFFRILSPPLIFSSPTVARREEQ